MEIKQVYLDGYGIDKHPEGCDCGLCDGKGKSYGVAIFNIKNTVDPVAVFYAPTYEAAHHNATLHCTTNDFKIVEKAE